MSTDSLISMFLILLSMPGGFIFFLWLATKKERERKGEEEG